MAKYRLIIEWDDFTQVRLGAPPEVPKILAWHALIHAARTLEHEDLVERVFARINTGVLLSRTLPRGGHP